MSPFTLEKHLVVVAIISNIFKEKEEEVKTAFSPNFKIIKTISKMSSEFSSHFGSKR
jgi:hypothetical protein